MRVLLIGGGGQLGTAIRSRWRDCEIVAPPRAQAELEDAESMQRALDVTTPNAVVNCAAFHDVDRCEREPERAFAVNALAVERLARLCRDRDAAFVTISTDYVFRGDAREPYTETDAPHPLSAYAASKLAGELLVERLEMRAFVVRTCGVYGARAKSASGHPFAERIIAQARAGEPVRVVSDVVVSPTYAGHLADALRALLSTQAYGLYHAANVGPVSWHAFATEVLRQAGIRHAIEPLAAKDWKAPARRPIFSALASEKLKALGISMPTWEQGIADYLKER